MSISSVGSTPQIPTPTTTPSKTALASDGDTAAQEAAESRSTKLAEKNNGGFAPKPTVITPPVTATASTANGVNKVI